MATRALKVVAPAPPSKPRAANIGAIIDKLWSLREEKRLLAMKEKELNADIEVLETQLYERMDKEGTTKSAGAKASVSLGTTDVFQIEDFDLFAAYVGKNKFYHLFERRVSQLAAREIFEKKGTLPGLTTYTKRKINLTTTSK